MSENNPLLNPCGCNGLSSKVICGDFEDSTIPDTGRCMAPPVKTDCEAPVVPPGPCGEEDFVAIYTPGANPPFTIFSKLFDESCNPILDQSGNNILTVS